MGNKKSCFIISTIGDSDSEEREWADYVRKRIVEPAVKECGHSAPKRADDPDIDLLMTNIIKQMFEADLVIADLTDFNPNVFFELGLRQCSKKPAIHLIRTDQKPPFDLGGNKAIFIDMLHETTLKAIDDIKERIEAIEANPDEFYSQVHLYLELKKIDILKAKHKDSSEALLNLCEKVVVMMEKTTSLMSGQTKVLLENIPKKRFQTPQGPLQQAIRQILQEEAKNQESFQEDKDK